MTVKMFNRTPVAAQNLGLYSGDIAHVIEPLEGEPALRWHGAPIPVGVFRQLLSFFKWSYAEHKVEAQARLFYNDVTHEWRPVVLPQLIWSSGHTREVEDDDEVKTAILAELLNAGFGQAGTAHHHSTMGAFQSSGDLTDELGQSGFHFTVGHMTSSLADFHARATFRKICYEKGLPIGLWMPGLHNGKLEPEIARMWLDMEDLPVFPEEWKERMIERKIPARGVVTGFGHYGGEDYGEYAFGQQHAWARGRAGPSSVGKKGKRGKQGKPYKAPKPNIIPYYNFSAHHTELLADTLASFRDDVLSEDLDAAAITSICRRLTKLSATIAHEITICSRILSPTLTDAPEYRSTFIAWLDHIQVVLDAADDADWDQWSKCLPAKPLDLDFKELMLESLQRLDSDHVYADDGTISGITLVDGTIVSLEEYYSEEVEEEDSGIVIL